MRLRHTVVSAVLVSTLLGFGTFVQAAEYSIDPTHSSIGFKIRHLVSQTKGQFTDFAGTFQYDPKSPAKASVNAVIQAKSINTQNEKRDGHLRNADFFDVEKFPTLTFKSSSAKSTGPGKLEIAGTLTMHGVSNPVVLNVEGGEVIKTSWGDTRTGFTATTTVNRKDFGIAYNTAMDTGGMMLGDDVKIEIEIEGIEKK